MGRRTSWGFIDQALSSVTNFGATVVAARVLTPSHLGDFAVAAATYIIVLTFSRGALSEPVLLRFSAARAVVTDDIRTAQGLVIGLASFIGAILASAALLFMHGQLRSVFIVLAALLPPLLAQDFLRFLALTFRAPLKAVAMDGTWLAAQAACVGAFVLFGNWTPATALLAWLLPGALSTVVGYRSLRVYPSGRWMGNWLRRHGGLSVRFAADGIVSQASGQLLVISVTAISSSAQGGYFRVAQTVFGPLVVIFGGVRLVVVPELVRLRGRGKRRFDRVVRVCAQGLGALCVAWGTAAWLVPPHLGRAAFGASWAGAHRLLLPLIVSFGAAGVGVAAFAGIRACADARRGLLARTTTGIMTLVAGSIGAVLAGAMGASVALGISAPFAALIWWAQFRRARDGDDLTPAGTLDDFGLDAAGAALCQSADPVAS